jgi:hypothetical protein
VTEREISESMQRKGPEKNTTSLMLGKASDKPRRRCERERIIENWNKFPSDIMAWQGGVARALRMNPSKPMVGWKGEHPQSVSWMQPVIDKYSHILCNWTITVD